MSSRTRKNEIRSWLKEKDWRNHIDTILHMEQKAIPSLFSLLQGEPLIKHRAAVILGKIIAHIANSDLEKAKEYIRQFMWRMNEDSGNIGWGIPEAFAETLAACSILRKDYARILLSYIIELGFADNYCDYAPLRRSCYWSVGRLIQRDEKFGIAAKKWLLKGLEDEDEICRGMACWALSQLPPDEAEKEPLTKLLNKNNQAICEIFDGNIIDRMTVEDLVRKTMQNVLEL